MLTILRVFLFRALRLTGVVAIYTVKRTYSNKAPNKTPTELQKNLKLKQ